MTENEIYQRWFTAYLSHPNKDHHFDNILKCLKEDIDRGIIKSGSATHKKLQTWYKNYLNEQSKSIPLSAN
jgi:alpha-galactosidase